VEQNLAFGLQMRQTPKAEQKKRVAAALAEGYVLHGSPAATFNGATVIVAQAVILPAAIATADAAVATAVDELDFDADFPGDGFEGHA
jgi:hypothetical protein